MNLGLVTLGCSKNRVDSEMLLGIFKDYGFNIVNDPAEADVIVVTNYFDRRNPESGNSFVKELHEKTDKPIIVVSNSPYEFTILDEYKTAICTYSSSVESFKELANVIFKGDGNVR